MCGVILSAVPPIAQVDLCTLLIAGVAAAMETPEGKEAVENGRQAYLRHLEEKAARLNGKEETA